MTHTNTHADTDYKRHNLCESNTFSNHRKYMLTGYIKQTRLALKVNHVTSIDQFHLAFAYMSSLHMWGLEGLTFGSYGHIHPLYHIRLCLYLLLSQTAADGMPAEGKAGREKERESPNRPSTE